MQQFAQHMQAVRPAALPEGDAPIRPTTAHLLARVQGGLRREEFAWRTVAIGGVAVAAIATALLWASGRRPQHENRQEFVNNPIVQPAPRTPSASDSHELTQHSGQESPNRGLLPVFHHQKSQIADQTSHLKNPDVALKTKPEPAPVTQQVTQDDLKVLNPDRVADVAVWTRWPSKELKDLEANLQQQVKGGDTFVHTPLPQLAGADERSVRAATVAYRQERAIVDARLVRKIHLAVKGMPLGDLCQQLSEQSGVQIAANRNVADDKVTVFCNPRPLRDIMRQLSGLFGFSWERTGQEGTFAYVLTQPLQSQLLEEGLRQKDRDEMMVLLERQMEGYRKYLGLSHAQIIREKAKIDTKTAFNEFNHLWLLEQGGLVAANMFFRLSPQELDALRDGQELSWDLSNGANLRLPAQVLEGQEEAYRHSFVTANPEELPKDLHLKATLKLDSKDPSHFELRGGLEGGSMGREAVFAVVKNPAREKLRNSRIHANLANDPALQTRVALHINPTCRLSQSPHPDTDMIFVEKTGPKVLAEDVLEALFKATGRDVIGDQFLRLTPADAVQVEKSALFDALNRVGDALQLGWTQSEGWIAFRTPDYHNARLEEIPEPLLKRWAQARKEKGLLSLEDMTEISQLTDAQLNSVTSTQVAVGYYGLEEWPMVRVEQARPHWRFLAQLPQERQREAFSDAGLAFKSLSADLQKRFLALSRCAEVGTWPSEAEMRDARLHVTYQPKNTADNFAQNQDALLPTNPVLFIYSYGRPTRYSVIGPFNGMEGLSEEMMQEHQKRSSQQAKP